VKREAMREDCDQVTKMMKAIAHPQRLLMLSYLARGEKTVGELQGLCDISQSQLSQFLNRLLREKLLEVRKKGNFSYYKIGDQRLKKLLSAIEKTFC